ncbi:MAG: hypothetical protein H6937_02480 [Burkholderiales bacterium]|nr:hypothetical protein [Burkholderiales bacterium]
MAGLLNLSANAGAGRGQTVPTYATPKATTLMGAGNSKITDDQIRAFIQANKNDPGKILQTALDNNISINQYANAAGIDPSQAKSFVESQGISLSPVKNNTPLLNNTTKTTQGSIATNTAIPNNPFGGTVEVPTVTPEKISTPDKVTYNDIAPPPAVTYNPATISTTRINPQTDTVQGQLNKILEDPNSPLMVAARTRGEQYANKRGLLNSSLGAEASNKAMIDSALNIATPDAATNANTALQNTQALNQGSMFNAQQGLLASQTNADNALRANMFNADAGLRTGMYNADNQLKAGMFNSDLSSKIGMFNTGTAADILKNRESLSTSILNNRESLENNLAIANLDVDGKLAVADLQARKEDSKYGLSLYDTYLKIQESINTNPDIPPDDKARYLSDAAKVLANSMNLLDTFDVVDIGDFNFGNNGNVGNNQSQNSQQQNNSGRGLLNSSQSVTNINGNSVEPRKIQELEKLNAETGMNYDPSKVLSESEMNQIKSDINYINNPRLVMKNYGVTPYQYYAKDGIAEYNNIWLYV